MYSKNLTKIKHKKLRKKKEREKERKERKKDGKKESCFTDFNQKIPASHLSWLVLRNERKIQHIVNTD